MNNKPIAWINEYDGLEPFNPDNRQEWIPLYTHPSEHDLGIAEAIGFEKGHESASTMLRQQQV
jgi:hypothetical protein